MTTVHNDLGAGMHTRHPHKPHDSANLLRILGPVSQRQPSHHDTVHLATTLEQRLGRITGHHAQDNAGEDDRGEKSHDWLRKTKAAKPRKIADVAFEITDVTGSNRTIDTDTVRATRQPENHVPAAKATAVNTMRTH
ncbi:hypothetical protein EDM35_15230, partial [Staphylococcus aureus]